MATAMTQAGRSARSAATMPADVGRGQRRQPSMADRDDDQIDANASRAALTMIEPRPNPPTRATTFTRWAET